MITGNNEIDIGLLTDVWLLLSGGSLFLLCRSSFDGIVSYTFMGLNLTILKAFIWYSPKRRSSDYGRFEQIY